MKRSTAIIGSSVLGIAAAVAVAAPASATGPTISTACTNVDQHVLGMQGGSNWYMDCIPQYGAGKAEFTIKANGSDPTAKFPAGFKQLSDPAVTKTASVDTPAGAAPYFGLTAPTGGYNFLDEDPTGSTASSQLYDMVMLYHLAGVQAVSVSDLPADCATTGDAYTTAWEVTYDPATITFDETVNGTKYTYTVTSAPQPLFLGLPLDPTNNNDFVTSPTASFCASDGTNVIQTSDPESDQALDIYFVHATVSPGGDPEAVSLSPYPSFDGDSEAPSIGQLGTFDPTIVKPTLATTGVDPVPGGMLGLGLAIIGGGAVVTSRVVRRRRRTARV